MPLGSIISAAASLFGGKKDDKRAKQERADVNYWNSVQLAESKRQFDLIRSQTIQDRVIDAQKAGIHPLYALGASPGVTSGFTAGQHASGSGAGSGLAGALSALGRGVSKYADRKALAKAQAAEAAERAPLVRAQARMYNAQALRDEAEALQIASVGKRVEQTINYKRPAPGVLESNRSTPGFYQRAIEVEPRRSSPLWTETVGPRGKSRVLNPDLGLDEVSQFQFVTNALGEWLGQKAFRAASAARRANTRRRGRKQYRPLPWIEVMQ